MTNRVRAAVGVTKNLGNYETMRFDYAVETDAREGETAEAALERAHHLVYTFLEKKIGEESF
jgi:hypothetical protein